MSAITAGMVKELRERTNAGMMECKKALSESGGDMERAVEILRERGLATALKKAGRSASEGVIASYIHMDKLGVLLELNCETDFVAKTPEFRELAKDIAMHVAAANPAYLSREQVPQEVIEKERAIYRTQVSGKPEHIVEKIIDGKMEKFYEENCLLEQVFVKDPEQKQKIRDLITAKVAKVGENIVLKRFARMQLGEAEG
ncbi:MAG: translation elongation factor Ts [Thermodesulfovibrionales bacterium]